MSGLEVVELTAPGRGAVSVLAVSGEHALARVQALAPRQRLARGRLCVAHLVVAGELLDEALVWPESERRVELHLHGSPPLVARLGAALRGPQPPRPPRGPGDPPDLEERASNLVAAAPTEAGARILLDQAAGALRRELERLAGVDESERRRASAELGERGRVLNALLSPPVVVLAGPVNAGKSTLFNALVGRERVVVHPERGTTRDLVRERVRLGAYAVDLVDTAGERPPDEADPAAEVERAGLELGRALRERADVVLWLAPGAPSAEPPRAVGSGVVVRLTSRADELAPEVRRAARRPIAARDDPGPACALVRDVVHEVLALPREPWTPGAAVPFEEALLARLARAAAGRLAEREWRSALDSILAR